MNRIAYIGLGLTFSAAMLVSAASAQTSAPAVPPGQSSLGDYARKVRKDPEAAKAKPKVFDNDNLPKTDKLSVVGQPAPVVASDAVPADAKAAEGKPAAADAKAAADGKTAAAAKPEDDLAQRQAAWKEWQGKLADQKGQIDLAARELDVLQREYQLRAAAEYADAGNRLRNSAQWDKQEADYKQKIADKQKALDDAKQKLTDMQEEARRAGVPSSMIE